MAQYARSLPVHPMCCLNIRVGAENGIRILSPEETAEQLPHYPGFGANLEQAEH